MILSNQGLELEKANIKWFLSIDNDDIPKNIKEKGKTTYRSIKLITRKLSFRMF